MSAVWAWALLILGLTGWIAATALATVIAVWVIHRHRQAAKAAETAASGATVPGAAPTGHWLDGIPGWVSGR